MTHPVSSPTLAINNIQIHSPLRNHLEIEQLIRLYDNRHMIEFLLGKEGFNQQVQTILKARLDRDDIQAKDWDLEQQDWERMYDLYYKT